MIIVLIIQSDLYLFYAILVVSRQISSPIRGHYSLALSSRSLFSPFPKRAINNLRFLAAFAFTRVVRETVNHFIPRMNDCLKD